MQLLLVRFFNLLNKGQCWCLFVCLSVLYRNPNRWRDRDEIWYWGGPREAGFLGGGVDPVPPSPAYGVCKGGPVASGASAMQFGEKFLKQKLQGAPDLVGAGHLFGPQIRIRKDLGPLSFWSHGHSLWRGVHKIKVALYVPNSYLVGLDTPYPDPRVKGGLVGFWSLSCVFWRSLYQTKVAGHLQISGGRSPYCTPNPDLEGPGPVCFWSHGASFPRRVYKIKVVVNVPYSA